MPRILHILTRPDDPFPARLALLLAERPHCQVESVDLTRGEPDYDRLLDQIFEAESVQVW